MDIDLGKLAEIKSKILFALSDDGKISLSEMRDMQLTKELEQELMTLLAGQPDMIGDGFVRKKTEDGSIIISAGEMYQGVKPMTDTEKMNFRARYNNNDIEEAFLQDGVLYFRNKNGEMIKGADGEYLSEKIYAEEKKLPFLDENGKIDNEKFMEYLNSLPLTDKEYTELMKDIEKASEEKSYWSIANCINSSKERCKEIFNLVKKDKFKEAGEALYSYFQEDCKAFDENVLLKIKDGLEIITGSKWAGPALYNVLSDLADDEDDNHISVGERVLVTADNVGQGLGDFIFSTEGLATMGAIAGGEALLAKASSTLAPYIGAAIHTYFGVEGTMLVADGTVKAATGETLEEIAEGGQEIGHGLPMMGTVIRAGKNVIDSGTKVFAERERVQGAKTLKELDDIFNDIIAKPLTAEDRVNAFKEYNDKRLQILAEIQNTRQELSRLLFDKSLKSDLDYINDFVNNPDEIKLEQIYGIYSSDKSTKPFIEYLKRNKKDAKAYLMFCKGISHAIVLGDKAFEPDDMFNDYDIVKINNNKNQFILLDRFYFKYFVIPRSLELFRNRLNLNENADVETIFDIISSPDGPLANETLSRDLYNVFMGTPITDACIYELECRIPDFSPNMRYADDLSSYKQKLKDVLHSEDSPYKDMLPQFIRNLEDNIDAITEVKTSQETVGIEYSDFVPDYINYSDSYQTLNLRKKIKKSLSTIHNIELIKRVEIEQPELCTRAKKYYLDNNFIMALSKLDKHYQEVCFELLDRGGSIHIIFELLTEYNADIEKYKILLEYGVEERKAAAYVSNEEYYQKLLAELEQKINPLKKLLDSPEYADKVKKVTASKYQKEFLELFKPENMNYQLRAQIIETGMSEKEFLSSLQKFAKYTFKLLYEVPHQYLSGIDVKYSTPVDGKLPTPPEAELDILRDSIMIFIKENLSKILLALKYVDADTLNHFMDRRTELFKKTLDNISGLNPDNAQILSDILKCKSANKGKNLSPKEKMEFCKIIKIFQDAKMDMSILRQMAEDGVADVSAAKQLISQELLKVSGVDISGSDYKDKKFNEDYSYLALCNADVLTQSTMQTNINLFEVALPVIRKDKNKLSELINEIRLGAELANAHGITKEQKQILNKMIDAFKNISKYTDKEILDLVQESMTASCALHVNSSELYTVIREATVNDFQEYIRNVENKYGQANLQTEQAFKEHNLNHDYFLDPKLDDVEIQVGGKTVKIRIWGRLPQEDAFIGNKTTCCTGIGEGNGAATPLYLLNTCFSVVELFDADGKVVGMSRVYMAMVDGKPKLIMDNIEINNNFLKPLTYEEKIAVRDGYFRYMNQYAEKIIGEKTEVYYCARDAVDVPTENLEEKDAKVDFIGKLSSETVYFNTSGCSWVKPEELKNLGDIKWFVVPQSE